MILDQGLKFMQDAGLKIDPRNLTVLAKISYLGHTITEQGINANLNETLPLKNWPENNTIKDLMSLLKFCYFPHFSKIAKLLAALMQEVKYWLKHLFRPASKHPTSTKHITSEWTEDSQNTGDELIE